MTVLFFPLIVFGSLDVVKIVVVSPFMWSYIVERLDLVMVKHLRRREGYSVALPFFLLAASELLWENSHFPIDMDLIILLSSFFLACRICTTGHIEKRTSHRGLN